MPEAAGATTRAALLRARRERALLSQEELADRAGLSVRTVRNIEAERLARPHPATVRRISAALTAAGAPPPGPDGEPASDELSCGLHQLPSAIADFTGREAEVREMRALLARDPAATGASRVLSVTGLGGVGKTALAVHVAHLVRERFGDGQLYVDLHGAGPCPRRPADVLARFLLALGVTAIPDGLEERAALYRSMLDGRQVLVLLDNAADEAQVRPLLAGAGCANLVTSRARLVGLEGARSVVVDVLGAAESAALLGRIAGADRVAGQCAAERIATACGGLPLAIRIAAARLAARPHWTTATLADLLDDERERLDELRAGDLEVRASFGLSYQMLDETQRRAFRALALLDAPDFPGWVLAALLGEGDRATDRAVRRAHGLTEQLVDAQLLQISGLDGIGQARYRIHDLLRVYGRERAFAEDTAADRRAALQRVLSGWLALAERADELLPSGEHLALPRAAPRWKLPAAVAEALVTIPAEWFEAEQATLVSAVHQAAEQGCHELTWELAGSLTAFLELRSRHDDWQRTHETALAAARSAGNTGVEGLLLCRLGNLHLDRNQLDDALDVLAAALVAHRSAADSRGESHTLQALSHAHRLRGQPGEARRCAEQAIEILHRSGEQRGLAGAHYYLGSVLVEQDLLTDALAHFRRALDADEAGGDRRGAAMTSLQLARSHLALGDMPSATRCVQRCLEVQREVGDDRGQAYALVTLGEIQAAQHEVDDAAATLRAALVLARGHEDHHAAAHAHRAIGELSITGDQPSEALGALCSALTLFSELDLPRWRRRTLLALDQAWAAALRPLDDPGWKEVLTLVQRLDDVEARHLARQIAASSREATRAT